jgi:hypothetical protein
MAKKTAAAKWAIIVAPAARRKFVWREIDDNLVFMNALAYEISAPMNTLVLNLGF